LSSTLTSRYQTRENIITTRFATHIASLQVLFFIFYGASGFIARVFGHHLYLSNRNLYICSRQVSNVIPVFTFVLPIYSIHRLKHYRLKIDSKIRSVVTMESRGVAGSRNYEEFIRKKYSASSILVFSKRHMTQNQTASEFECRKIGLNLVEYPLYRVVQAIHTFLSMASLPLLLHVQIKYIFGSTFHRNIKIILLLYYSLALLHSAAYTSIQIHAITSSVIKRPCDFFPPTYVYIPLHLTINVSWYGLMFSLMAISCERGVATTRSSKYESKGITLGVFLLAFVVIGVFGTIRYVYSFEDFNVKVWSVLAIPPGAVNRANHVAILNTSIGIICIITLHVFSRINKKRCSVNSTTLTSRYQTLENTITTRFATHIASLQV
ncbi:hypothetical protein KIN20_029072, partial [Parelaphostrongylus tenuis]